MLRLFLFLAVLAAPAAAQGTLDPTFGGFGTVILAPTVFDAAATRVSATQVAAVPAGVLVVARVSGFPTGDRIGLVRLTEAGAVDASYGDAGVRLLDVGGIGDAGIGADVQPDGSVWLATTIGDTDRRVAVAHVLADGTLDAAFGTAGVALADVGEGFEEVSSVVYDETLRVVTAVGGINTAGVGRVATVRFTLAGVPDPTYGTNGVVLGPAGPPNRRALAAIAGASAGSLAFTGIETAQGVSARTHTGRLAPDGTPDPSFPGTTTVFLGQNTEYGLDIDATPDGGLLVTAQVVTSDFDAYVALARFTASGAPDATWGADGLATVDDAGTSDRSRASVIAPDGSVFVAGTASTSGQPSDASVYHLSASGAPDPAWGTGGRELVGLAVPIDGPQEDAGAAVAIDGAGRVLLAGSTRSPMNNQASVLVARLASGTSTVATPAPSGETLALTVAPNPTHGAARLGVTLAEAGEVYVTLTDVLGRTVVALDRALGAGPQTVDLDTSGLAPGLYVVRLLTPTGAASRALTIDR